jgi:hypothetical protein
MDTPNIKKTQSLEQVLVSYDILTACLFLFFILIIILKFTNPKGFNIILGYEIFITGPILLFFAFIIKELFIFISNPEKAWLSSFSMATESWFLPAIIILSLIIGLAGFFSMLAVGGIFNDKPPENNTAMIFNFFIIILFVFITISIYSNGKNKDNLILHRLPNNIQNIFALRTQYTTILFIFIFLVILLYFVNPWSIMTNYGGQTIFFTLFVGIILTIMITIYQYYLSNPSKANLLENDQSVLSLLVKAIYILGSIGISGLLIFYALKFMGIFNQDASKPSSWAHIILNLILLCGMLGIIYKLANAGGFLDRNPYYRLILNTILYIPCFLISTLNYLGKVFGIVKGPPGVNSAFKPPNKFELKMLGLSLLLLSSYFFWILFANSYITNKILKQGGQQLINQPIQTDILSNIAAYQTLTGSDKFDYQYALSFWFYLDSFPPSTNSSYLKIVPILSYGDNPAIRYSSKDNTIYITVKQKTEENVYNTSSPSNDSSVEEVGKKWNNLQDKIKDTIEQVKQMPFVNEIDADGNRIIYKHPDVLLQRWNHIVLNFNGGTLDVFYNGKLVKSAIEVVPYMKFDMLTTGTENGVSGNIANLMYFKNPIDILTIHKLYNSLKDKNPPVIPENTNKIIPFIKN